MTKIKEKTKEVKPKWEIKDKIFELILNETPIVFMAKSRGILWFDEEKGYEREIKYCENQKMNPHLHRSILAMGISEEDKDDYVNNVLFEEI
jgi:hypothetical protein